MFDSITDLAGKLAKTGYFIDPVMIQVVFLAAKLQKPLLLEGPAGSGKSTATETIAQRHRSLSAFGTEVSACEHPSYSLTRSPHTRTVAAAMN